MMVLGPAGGCIVVLPLVSLALGLTGLVPVSDGCPRGHAAMADADL